MEWQGELRRGERGVHRSGRFGEYRTARDGTWMERIVMAGKEWIVTAGVVKRQKRRKEYVCV